MLSIVSPYVTKFAPKPLRCLPLTLDDFNEVIHRSDDEWNNVPGGNIRRTYFTKTTQLTEIGHIDYRVATGQIGLFFIYSEKYKNNGLGKQMLTRAINDIRTHGTATTVWGVTSDDHPCFSNIWNKRATWKSPAHSSVKGSGYSIEL